MGITPSGEFLTRIVRKKYWKEDKSFEECKEFIFNCVECDSVKEREDIGVEILNVIFGSKKFIGREVYETVLENR